MLFEPPGHAHTPDKENVERCNSSSQRFKKGNLRLTQTKDGDWKLEELEDNALDLWITALMLALPARWVDILPKIPHFKFFIQFKAIFLAKVVVIKGTILRKICQKNILIKHSVWLSKVT